MLEEAILIGIAAWRITALLSYEKGPFFVFSRIRELIGFTHNPDGEPMSWPSGFLTDAVSCVWCLGLYSAAAMWGLWQLSQAAVIVIAASSVLIAVERWNRP